MSDFDHHINIMIQKYLSEVKQQDLSIEEIQSRPRSKRVWFYWKALAHYENKPMPELTFEEVKRIYGD